MRLHRMALLATTAMIGAGFATAVSAQVAAKKDPVAAEIIVTGSRLANPNFTAPTPVQTITAETIMQRAPVQISDVVNEMPAVRVSRSAAGSGRVADQQSGVQALTDLRGLGDVRTLVLVNGHRHVGTVASGSFDTNMIPVNLIERVDVVTGGASAAYGSDAVAGVVNFVLKKRMKGITASAQGGVTGHGDGAQYAINLAGGTDFADGRGHIVAGFDWGSTTGVGNIYSRFTDNQGLLSVSAAQRASLGLPAQAFATDVVLANVTAGGLITTKTTSGLLYGFDTAGNASVFNQGTVFGSGTSAVMTGSTANAGYSPYAFFQLQNKNSRMVGYGRASFDISDNWQAYAEVNYAHTSLPAQLTSSYLVSFQVPVTSLPSSVQSMYTGTNVSVGRIMTENGGGNLTWQNLDMHDLVGGFSGKIGKWKAEVYAQHGWTHQDFNTSGLVLSALYKAVYGCNGTASNPNMTSNLINQLALYESTTGKSCVAFNPFGTNNSSAALNYIYNNQHQDTVISKDVVSASLSGVPFALWAGDVSVALGGEWRKDKLTVTSDALGNGNVYSVGNFTTYGGQNTVKEGFLELGVPLARDIMLARSLDLNAAFRRTDYAISGAVTTWKVGGVWQPISGLRARATWSRDIRAPNLNDLYFIGGALPTSTTNNIPGTYGYGVTGTTNIYASGNTTLRPEKADTFTGGFTWSAADGPLRGLRLAVDYYNIRINGAIARPTSAQTQSICAGLIASGATTCPGIVFGTTGNGLVSAGNLSVNLNQLKSEGLDFELGYRLPDVGLPGRIELRAFANYAIHLQQFLSLNRQEPFDTAGSAQGVPKWTGTATISYIQGQSGIDLQLRGFTGVKYDTLSAYTLTGGTTNGAVVVDPTDAGYVNTNANTINTNRLPGMVYANLSFHVGLRKDLQLFGVINNLFDRQPPLYTVVAVTSGNRNLNYDLLGRSFKLGVRAQF
jgi:iron complex outermembrane receptor protein